MGLAGASIEKGLSLNDGRSIPRIGFGTYALEQGDEAYRAVCEAIHAGYRLIDCARFYGNERSVGRAIADCGVPRDELFVTSKVWNDRQLNGQVRQSCEESLSALGVDRLDLLLIHWPVEGCYRKTWEVFQDLQAEGLVASIGVSNFRDHHLRDLAADGDAEPAVDQMQFNPFMQDRKTLGFCRERGIVYEAWSPLGRGTCLADPMIGRIARAHGVDAAQVVLAWEEAKGIVPLPKTSNVARMGGNLRSLDVLLSSDELAAIDRLDQGKPVDEGIDPEHFAAALNALASPHD